MMTMPTFEAAPVSRRCSVLRDSVIAASFGAEDLMHLAELGEVVTLSPGSAVFEAGAPADHLFVVLEGAFMPAVLVEIGFITNRPEVALLKTPAYRQRIAESLQTAVGQYQRALKRGTAAVAER